ncbi:MAG: beta-galactosidase [Planctomycetia bacterium]|nr:beta-galactosidase [Planctomycetia bacterium]
MTKWMMAGLVCLTAGVLSAQIPIDYTHDRVQSSLDPGFQRIGTVTPRSAKEVGRSNIAIGCEMLPRDYGDFEQFKMYIAPLGVKRIRLHAGWAKIEPQKGVYDFEWLDKQVNYLVEQGMDVLLETSYGNPIYPGGGGASLSDGLPHGEEALAAWDRYVDALSKHYSHVKDWSCWNEPDGFRGNTPEKVADNNIRTAEMIKKNIPDARVAGLVLCWTNMKFTEKYLQELQKRGKIDLFTWFIYHDYRVNPDECYPQVEKWEALVKKYAPNAKIWQGESGATSQAHNTHPISSGKWNSELTQCKWNARRVIGDLGHGIETLVFTFYDPAYDQPHRYTKFVDPIWIRTRDDRFMKRMGLIKCNEDFQVLKIKPAYYSLQGIASVFDASIVPEKMDAQLDCAKKTAVYTFRQKETNIPLVAYWDCSSYPENENLTTPGNLTLQGVTFEEPVWVDTVTCAIYEIPAERMVKEGDTLTLKEMPVYDAPVYITEKRLVMPEK